MGNFPTVLHVGKRSLYKIVLLLFQSPRSRTETDWQLFSLGVFQKNLLRRVGLTRTGQEWIPLREKEHHAMFYLRPAAKRIASTLPSENKNDKKLARPDGRTGSLIQAETSETF
jgi:hypothetical protein